MGARLAQPGPLAEGQDPGSSHGPCASSQSPSPKVSAGRSLAKEGAIGFCFWLGFVLILEPGNVVRALGHGQGVDIGREALRMCAAGLLGACATPPVFALCRSIPVSGSAMGRTFALYGAALTGLSLVLLVVADGVARLALPGPRGPLGRQIAADLPLMVVALVGLVAVIHLVRGRRRVQADAAVGERGLQRIAVTSRGETRWVAVAAIDWLETQGNYVSLHVGAAEHLLRETSARLEARLDPERFVRVHRRAIVAIDRIASVTHLGSGDFDLRLTNGTVIRGSRRHRPQVLAKAGLLGGPA